MREPIRKRRAESELNEAKQVLSRARARSGASAKDIANALDCAPEVVYKLMDASQSDDHMRVGDLLLLAKHPTMQAFVTEVLGAIVANYEHRHLRILDLEAMMHDTATADIARIALRPVAARLWPEIGPVTTAPKPDGA